MKRLERENVLGQEWLQEALLTSLTPYGYGSGGQYQRLLHVAAGVESGFDPRAVAIAKFLIEGIKPDISIKGMQGTWEYFRTFMHNQTIKICVKLLYENSWLPKLSLLRLGELNEWPASLDEAISWNRQTKTGMDLAWPVGTYALLKDPNLQQFLEGRWLPSATPCGYRGTGDARMLVGIKFALQAGYAAVEPRFREKFYENYFEWVGSRDRWPTQNYIPELVEIGELLQLGPALERLGSDLTYKIARGHGPAALRLGKRGIIPSGIGSWSNEESFSWRQGVTISIAEPMPDSEAYARFKRSSDPVERYALWWGYAQSHRYEHGQNGQLYHPFCFMEEDSPEIPQPEFPTLAQCLEWVRKS